jgi:hypothetical protein
LSESLHHSIVDRTPGHLEHRPARGDDAVRHAEEPSEGAAFKRGLD